MTRVAAPEPSGDAIRARASMDGAAPALLPVPATLAPDRSLLHYYLLRSLLAGPAFLVLAAALYFRFRTLRYDVDDEGITMRWGILFRREVSLTYARIQDIQLTSNVVERWLGLSRIQLQTASGSASAEMTIEGIPDGDTLRDFLYNRMRGARDTAPAAVSGRGVMGSSSGAVAQPAYGGAAALVSDAGDVAQLTFALDAVASELRAVREALAVKAGTDA
jgi:putative membrane protein